MALLAAASTAILSTGRAIGAPVSGGDQLWVSTLNDPADNTDQANAVAVSPDGSKVFVTGYSSGSTGIYDYTTAAYDAVTGSPLWQRRYDGPGHGYDTAKAVTVSPDGSKVFVTGGSDGTGGYEDIATIAYDAGTGSKLWLARYDGSGHKNDWGLSIAASPDGSKVFVAGYANRASTRDDFTVLAYAAGAGTSLWTRFYNGPGTSQGDQAYSVAASPDGARVFATGFAAAGSTSDIATMALDATTGGPLWLMKYNGPGNNSDGGEDVAVSPDGQSVFVAGDSAGAGLYYDYATIAYDAASGAQKWVKRYDGPAHRDDITASVAMGPDGSSVFVTGNSVGSGTGVDYATVAYDAATGSPLWTRRYDGPVSLDDGAEAVGVSPDGSKVFVTGHSEGSTGATDYATQAYDAGTGTVLWESRFDGPGHDYDDAFSLAVGPDGSSVFVTGSSYSTTTADDWATVAYSA